MQSIIDTKFPTDPNDLTPEILTAAISSERPGLIVERLEVVQAFYAATGQASTADRVILNLDYAKEAASAAAAEGLPRRVVLKTMLVSPHAPAVMYETEVRFYREIRPLVPFETPAYYGALFDPESGQFGIVLEDLTERGVVFPNVTMPTSMGQIRSLLRNLAALHAKYWESPKLVTDFAWMATPKGGGMEELFKGIVPTVMGHIEKEPWRGEILEPIGRSVPDLHADMLKVAAGPLEDGPRTLLHGDTHIGNTYRVDGEGDGDETGLLDFQLSLRGCYSRDLTYILTTALSIEERRKHERELIEFYLGELARGGVERVPTMDEAWLLHRQSALWGLVVGWLTCPTANYGREITEENIRRLAQIVIDLDSVSTVPD
jgi:hypothetical protein